MRLSSGDAEAWLSWTGRWTMKLMFMQPQLHTDHHRYCTWSFCFLSSQANSLSERPSQGQLHSYFNLYCFQQKEHWEDHQPSQPRSLTGGKSSSSRQTGREGVIPLHATSQSGAPGPVIIQAFFSPFHSPMLY